MLKQVPEKEALEQVLVEPWSYVLFRSEQRYYLSVLVSGRNSAANASMIIELTEDERSEFQQHGRPFIDALRQEIFTSASYFGAAGQRKDPQKHQLQQHYATRHIADFWEHYGWSRP